MEDDDSREDLGKVLDVNARLQTKAALLGDGLEPGIADLIRGIVENQAQTVAYVQHLKGQVEELTLGLKILLDQLIALGVFPSGDLLGHPPSE